MKLFGFLVLLMIPVLVQGQSGYFYKGHQAYSVLNRIDLKTPSNDSVHTAVKHYHRSAVMDFLNDFDKTDVLLSTRDREDLDYIHHDNPDLSTRTFEDFNKKEKGVFRHFYNSKAHFFKLDQKNFQLIINPVLNLSLGKEIDSDHPIFQNTRGLEVRGLIDNKIYFSSRIFENQAKFYNYINREISNRQSIPGQGFYKSFQSAIIDDFEGYDYLNAEAYFGIPISQSVAIELGHSNHFIGNGYRSLLLNDYSNNYFYLKLYLQVWKFYYHSIFAELAPISANLNPNNELLSKKYMASHFLSYKAGTKFEIGLFESVVFSRENNFELQYLNPVILYRSVEQFLDSPDNVIIGLNAKWNGLKNTAIYSQVILDEFKLSEITSGDGWWGNKYGIQLGLSHVDLFGIDHLDLRMEYNMVRPFTYSHRDTVAGFDNYSLANYSHYGQPLAHPLGSNFEEAIFILGYSTSKKINLEGKLLYAVKGDNSHIENYGGDIFVPVETRLNDFGYFLGNGIPNNITSLSFDFSYQVFHNYYLDLKYLYRKSDSEDDSLDLNTQYFGFGFRVNMDHYKIDY